MTDKDDDADEKYNTQGTPNHGSTEADTASGGGPEESGQEAETGEDNDGKPSGD